jgi:hypothetical protein
MDIFKSFLSGFHSRKIFEPPNVVLREERSGSDYRYLGASYNKDGDLIIEGQDLGALVEENWGSGEYEWTLTISKADLPLLANALGIKKGILNELKNKFNGVDSNRLEQFLKENNVPTTFWSRTGD